MSKETRVFQVSILTWMYDWAIGPQEYLDERTSCVYQCKCGYIKGDLARYCYFDQDLLVFSGLRAQHATETSVLSLENLHCIPGEIRVLIILCTYPSSHGHPHSGRIISKLPASPETV